MSILLKSLTTVRHKYLKYVRETLGLVNSYDTWHGTVVFLAVYKCIMLLTLSGVIT